MPDIVEPIDALAAGVLAVVRAIDEAADAIGAELAAQLRASTTDRDRAVPMWPAPYEI